MAEYVKGRFHAARVGATMAILGLLAGLGIKNETQPPTTTVIADPAAAQILARNSIGSAQIKNHSLLFSDLKLHQVPSYKEYKVQTSLFNDKWLKLDPANVVHKVDVYDKQTTDTTFLKINDAGGMFLKLSDATANFLQKADAEATFLQKDATAANALKIDGLSSDQIVQGHGQVVTGSTALGASDSDLFVLIGLLRATAKQSPQGGASADVTLTNLSTDTLTVNGDGKTVQVSPGGTDTVSFADGSVHTFQVIQGNKQAITVGLSSFTGGVHTIVGQAVVGAY